MVSVLDARLRGRTFFIFLSICRFNQSYFKFIQGAFSILHPQNFEWKELLLGECCNMDVVLWNKTRSLLLFHLWKDRNEALYKGGSTNHKSDFVINIKKCALQVLQKIEDACIVGEDPATVMKDISWKQWDKGLNMIYSSLMVHGILSH